MKKLEAKTLAAILGGDGHFQGVDGLSADSTVGQGWWGHCDAVNP